MDTLLERRKLMFSISNTEESGGTLADYVQDGLFLHMDGKYGKGGSTWVSVVNGWTFTNVGATFGPDYVYFDGVDDYLRCSSMGTAANFPGTKNGATIEVVIDNENFGEATGVIFIPKVATCFAAAVRDDGWFIWTTDNSSSRPHNCPILTQAKASISVASYGNTTKPPTRQYQNGVPCTLSTGTTYLSGFDNSGYYYIGKKKAGDFFKGKIYSIRVYNRRLSEQEILQNLSVDNIRFKLGLTLE